VTAPLGFGSVAGLYAVEDGHPFRGAATVVYSPAAQRVSVTVTGVTSFPASGWYLNLHQGNSGNILDAAGQPTIFFRPLLCANI
jgi:hypothetical protein